MGKENSPILLMIHCFTNTLWSKSTICLGVGLPYDGLLTSSNPSVTLLRASAIASSGGSS